MEQQRDIDPIDKMTVPKIEIPPTAVDADEWCCIYWILSLQDDFLTEKPII
jgi:hypothetical protein